MHSRSHQFNKVSKITSKNLFGCITPGTLMSWLCLHKVQKGWSWLACAMFSPNCLTTFSNDLDDRTLMLNENVNALVWLSKADYDFFTVQPSQLTLIFMFALPALVTTWRVKPCNIRRGIAAINNHSTTQHNSEILFLHQVQCLVLDVLHQLQLIRDGR